MNDHTEAKPVADLLPQGFALDLTSKAVCWLCGAEILTKGSRIHICQPCGAKASLTANEKTALLDSSDRRATYVCLMAARNRKTPQTITGAPAEYANAIPCQAVAEWARRPTLPILVLMGQVGRGKTYQGWAALGFMQREHWSTMAVKCSALARVAPSQVPAYKGAGALLLDDLGARTSPSALATALEIMDERLEHHAPTIVTTNMEFAQMYELEPRLASRLGASAQVRIEGPDRRLQKSITDRFVKARTA